MSTSYLPKIFNDQRVVYECTCGKQSPITRIYFCRHCFKLRCRDCVCHEVDSQYCQHCLEYIPTIDAKLKKNKCSSCFSCPCCEHTLSTRAFLTPVKSAEDPNVITQKKNFFLVCYFCKWTSRDSNISDQPSAAGSWPEVETPNAKRIDQLFEHYRNLAQKEKFEKEKKRVNLRTGHAIHLLDKYGISASLSPKVRAQFYAKMSISPTSPTAAGGFPGDLKSPTESVPATAVDDLDDFKLPNDFYTREVDLNNCSSISQRMTQVERQPESITEFQPMSQMLSVKRNLRCKECEHNLSKPEYNPSSIKFKILLAAYYHVPEVRLKTVPKLTPGVESFIELSVQNPTPYELHITFLNSTDADDVTNCTLKLPTVELVLPAKDETFDVDVDALGDKNTARSTEDPAEVTFRRGNKLGLAFPVTLRPGVASSTAKVSFHLKHDFLNSMVQIQGSDKREPQLSWVSHKVVLNLAS